MGKQALVPVTSLLVTEKGRLRPEKFPKDSFSEKVNVWGELWRFARRDRISILTWQPVPNPFDNLSLPRPLAPPIQWDLTEIGRDMNYRSQPAITIPVLRLCFAVCLPLFFVTGYCVWSMESSLYRVCEATLRSALQLIPAG